MRGLIICMLTVPLAGCALTAPPALMGYSGVTQMDVARYKPVPGRDAAYFACLNETAGKGREPFDACMNERGYTR
jgi:hypothetical protein